MAVGKVVFVGTGAIGASVAAWLAPHHPETYCVDRGETLEALRSVGIRHYDGSKGPDSAEVVRVRVMEDLSLLGVDDIVVFGVKNYSLDAVAKATSEACHSRPLAVSMANGLDNQAILPRHFSRTAYCVVGYNAWLDAPAVVGWQNRGPLVLGAAEGPPTETLKEFSTVLSRACEVEITDRLLDAARSKLIVNLVNTITTLVGYGFREERDIASLQRLMTRALYEGILAVRAAGGREYHVGNMPSWAAISAGALLPRAFTKRMFRKSLSAMVKSSMSQDVLARGRAETELDSLTGYIVQLAKETGTPVPYNEALYRIAKESFSRPGFRPYSAASLLEAVRSGGMPRVADDPPR